MTTRLNTDSDKGLQMISPSRLALYGTLTLFAALFALPFVWQLGGSLKTPAELASGSFNLSPPTRSGATTPRSSDARR